MPTNVPQPSFTPTGFVAPAEADTLSGVLADFQAAFGGNLNPDATTPQGQLATSLNALIGYKNDLFLRYVNQIDPSYASGRMQDAIARIYFLERQPSEPTVVDAVCSGATGTIIPAGSLALATDGSIYSSLGQVTIPSSGSVTTAFANTTYGPIACGVGSLNRIYRTIPGWDSINNLTAGTLGRYVENRRDFEDRRAASVALNSVGALPAIRASVLNVPGILDAFVTENPASSAVTIGGVSIAPKSLYVAAVGATDANVAFAIWRKKAPGCGYNGNTTVTVTDPSAGYATAPTYAVTFQRPAALPIKFAVSLVNGTDVPSDVLTQVRAAIVAAFAGLDGGPRQTIGSTVYASRFYAPVASLGSWVRIVSIKVGDMAATVDDLVSRINQVPTVDPSDITVSLT